MWLRRVFGPDGVWAPDGTPDGVLGDLLLPDLERLLASPHALETGLLDYLNGLRTAPYTSDKDTSEG